MTSRYKLYSHDNSFIREYDIIPEHFTGIAIYVSGSKHWFTNGKKHRVEGPASEYTCGSKEWYINGKLHRLDGLAVKWHDGTKNWCIDGKIIEGATEKSFKLLIDIMKLKGLI